MKISSKIVGKVALIAAVASFSSLASAQFYVGGSIGQSLTSFDDETKSKMSAGPSSAQYSNLSSSIDEDKNRVAFKAFVGYSFNPYVAVETGYAHFGTSSFTNNVSGTHAIAGAFNASHKMEYDKSAWFLAGKGTLPINDKFGVFGKLGMSLNRTKATESLDMSAGSGTSFTDSWNNTKTGFLYGVGAEYNLNKAVSFNLEYMDFGKFGKGEVDKEIDKTSTAMWSFGATYKF